MYIYIYIFDVYIYIHLMYTGIYTYIYDVVLACCVLYRGTGSSSLSYHRGPGGSRVVIKPSWRWVLVSACTVKKCECTVSVCTVKKCMCAVCVYSEMTHMRVCVCVCGVCDVSRVQEIAKAVDPSFDPHHQHQEHYMSSYRTEYHNHIIRTAHIATIDRHVKKRSFGHPIRIEYTVEDRSRRRGRSKPLVKGCDRLIIAIPQLRANMDGLNMKLSSVERRLFTQVRTYTVYIYICVCIYIYLCMYICMCVYVRIYETVFSGEEAVYAGPYIYSIYICVCVYLYVYIYIVVYTGIYMCVYIPVYVYI